MLRYISLSLCGATILCAAPHASAQDVLSLIQAKKESGQQHQAAPKNIPFTYLVDMEMKGSEGDEDESFTLKYRVNPAADPGSRITILSGELTDYSKDVQKEIARLETETTLEDMADEFWCVDDDEDGDMFSNEDITVLSEDEHEAVIALGPEALKGMMDDDDDDMPKKVIKRLNGEITLTKPGLEPRHMKIWLTKPTTIKIVAKIKEMNMEQRCAVAPNGIPYVSENKIRVTGKALGSSFTSDMTIRVSDLQPN